MGEESLSWSNSLEKIFAKTNFDNISSLGSKICELIGWINDAASEDSLDGVHKNFSVLDFLLNEITVPGTDAEVVDCHALGGSVVEEGDLVGSVHTNWVSN